MQKLVPGTMNTISSENSFKNYQKMIELTNGLTLSQVCSITSLDSFVIQNWVKRGYVARPIKKKYYDKQLARILMISSLKDAMKIEEIGALMVLINGDVEDESDDLISEVDLYNLLVKVVYNLKDEKLIDETIKEVLKKEKYDNDKLFTALDIMTHGYIAGRHKQEANRHLNILKQID